MARNVLMLVTEDDTLYTEIKIELANRKGIIVDNEGMTIYYLPDIIGYAKAITVYVDNEGEE